MRGISAALLLMVALAVISCSAVNPTDPGNVNPVQSKDTRTAETNRWVWGNWRMYIPADHSSISITPAREANLHYNVKTLLENGPCDNCIWASGFKNNGDGTISVKISIRHPYPGNKFFTGFDVRGILYTTARYDVIFFDESAGVGIIPSILTGDPELLNPDGFTDGFDAWDDGYERPPIFDYQPGGDLGATFDSDDVNYPTHTYWPYIDYYSSEVRRQFASFAVVERTYHIALPAGEFKFGYSVDACWAEPTKVPVTNIEADFPPQANTLVPYRIDVFLSGPLIDQESVDITVRVYHHIKDMLPFIDLIGVMPQYFMDPETDFWLKNPVIVDNKYVEFKGEIRNNFPFQLQPGRYAFWTYPIIADGAPSMHDIEKGFIRNGRVMQFTWVTVE